MRTPSKNILLLLNNAAAKRQQVTLHQPAQFIEDHQGRPLAMVAGRVSAANMAGATFFRSEIEAAGLTPDDVPNLRIIEDNEL